MSGALRDRWMLGGIRDLQDRRAKLKLGVPYSDPLASIPGVTGRNELAFTDALGVPVVRTALGDAIASAVGPNDVQRVPLKIVGHEGFEAL